MMTSQDLYIFLSSYPCPFPLGLPPTYSALTKEKNLLDRGFEREILLLGFDIHAPKGHQKRLAPSPPKLI